MNNIKINTSELFDGYSNIKNYLCGDFNYCMLDDIIDFNQNYQNGMIKDQVILDEITRIEDYLLNNAIYISIFPIVKIDGINYFNKDFINGVLLSKFDNAILQLLVFKVALSGDILIGEKTIYKYIDKTYVLYVEYKYLLVIDQTRQIKINYINNTSIQNSSDYNMSDHNIVKLTPSKYYMYDQHISVTLKTSNNNCTDIYCELDTDHNNVITDDLYYLIKIINLSHMIRIGEIFINRDKILPNFRYSKVLEDYYFELDSIIIGKCKSFQLCKRNSENINIKLLTFYYIVLDDVKYGFLLPMNIPLPPVSEYILCR